MAEWHGWSLTQKGKQISAAMHVGEIPGRKSIALYAQEGAMCTPLAYFLSKADAERFRDWLDTLIDKLEEARKG